MAEESGRPGRRPSYAELEVLVAGQAATIAELRAENASLRERVAEHCGAAVTDLRRGAGRCGA